MSTEVEAYIRALKKWRDPSIIKMGGQSAVLRDFKKDGTRDEYLVRCAPDDSRTIIEVARNRGVAGQKDPDFEVFKILEDGQFTKLTLRTQSYSGERLFRITHRKAA